MVGKVSINVVTLLFLLIPGLFGMKAFLQAYIKLDDLTRFDKLAVIMTIGSFALAVPSLVLNWDCWTTHVDASLTNPLTLAYDARIESNTWCPDGVMTFGDVMTTEQLSRLPLVVVIFLLGVHTAVVSSISYVFGWALNKLSDGPPREPKYIEQPGEYASKKTARESDGATVITTENEEIRGTIHRIGSPSEDYDILLKDPVKVIRDGNTDAEVDTRDLGAYTHHHYRDISRVRFPNLDTYDEYEIDLADATRRFEAEIGSSEGRNSDENASDDSLPPRTG
jgi:hypothetical protein